MPTDYHTVKAWFAQIKEMEDDAESIRAEIQRYEDNATQCTQKLSGMPGGSGQDKIADCVANTDDACRRLANLELEIKRRKDEAVRRIGRIPNSKSSELIKSSLYGYYVLHHKQIVIARELLLPCENRVSLYIRLGCQHLAQIWDEFPTG